MGFDLCKFISLKICRSLSVLVVYIKCYFVKCRKKYEMLHNYFHVNFYELCVRNERMPNRVSALLDLLDFADFY